MSDAPPATGMAWIPAATFRMGSDEHYPEEATGASGRGRRVRIDRLQVTNADFAAFVAATGYVTVAERPLDPACSRARRPRTSSPARSCSPGPAGRSTCGDLTQWWTWTPGACWRHPEGPASSLEGRDDHPVVHVAFADAKRYATWAGKALPTEAQWELAARGGLDGATYTWGDAPEPRGGRARELLARRLPLAPRARLRDDRAGRLVPGQRPRAVRHGRQRVGVDGGLVRAAPSRASTAARRRTRAAATAAAAWTRRNRRSRSRARWSRAARTCAPTATACATAPPPGARR